MATDNYATLFGIKNKWAPIVFTVFYFLIFCWYIFQSVRTRGRSSIYRALAFFSIMRIIAFSLRSALANNHKDQTNRGIGIAYAVFYNIGFFSLLLSAYNLLTNREKLANADRKINRFTSVFHRGRIVHLLLLIAVILGVVGISLYLRGTSSGLSLSHASTYIFLGVAVLIAILTIELIRLERSLRAGTTGTASPVGAAHHLLILFLIAMLLLMRTLFFTITAKQRASGVQKQYNEHFWYPFAVLTEFLVALLFIVPGLVPLPLAMEAYDEKHGLMNNNNNSNRNSTINNPTVTNANNNATATNAEYNNTNAHNVV